MDDRFDIDAYVAETAALLGIPLTAEAKAGVAVNLKRTADAAQLILGFEMAPDLDPAPVFEA